MRAKRALVRVLTSPSFRWAFRGWTRSALPIVMLHRFSDQPTPGRTSVESLDRALAAMRRQGLTPLSLGDLVTELAAGSLPERAICFTVDDGYRDFKEHAHPVFARYGAPVTVFVITGFIDGVCWNWWDRVHEAFAVSDAGFSGLRDGLGLAFSAGMGRWDAAEQMIASCKEVPDELRREALATLERSLAVQLPERPTESYAPMDWDDVRRLSGEGVEFGGHTVTHPILSRVDAGGLDRELRTSLESVERATGRPTRVFAYPNGRAEDYDDAAVEALKKFGVEAAVTTEPGMVGRADARRGDGLYHLPRLPLPEQPERQLALVCGLEAAKISLGWR